jgi:hypothetical protein
MQGVFQMVVCVSQNNKFITINCASFLISGALFKLWLRLHQVKTRPCQITERIDGFE